MKNMKLYDELVARGLIAQVTNEEEIREMIDNGKATFYIGFDCTADSLTAGHFMALTLMKRLQMAGNKPIALIGGGTTMIGDPSGRTDMRKMLTKEDINHNAECFKKQMEKFIDFSEGIGAFQRCQSAAYFHERQAEFRKDCQICHGSGHTQVELFPIIGVLSAVLRPAMDIIHTGKSQLAAHFFQKTDAFLQRIQQGHFHLRTGDFYGNTGEACPCAHVDDFFLSGQ